MPIDDLPAPNISDLPAPPKKEEVDPIKVALEKRKTAPFILGGVSELGKGVGAVTELVPGLKDTGKKIYEYSKGLQKKGKEVAPVGTTIGQIGSYAIPYGAAGKGFQAGRAALGLGEAGTLGRIGEGAITGAGVGYGTTSTEEGRTIPAIAGGLLGGGIPAVSALGKEAYGLLNRAFNNDGARLANALRDLQKGVASKEAQIAGDAIKQAENNILSTEKELASKTARRQSDIAIAEKAKTKQATQAQDILKGKPGVSTEEFAGEFKQIPETSSDIGNWIRKQADNFVNAIKTQRNKSADSNFKNVLSDAKQLEARGIYTNTRPILNYIDSKIAEGGTSDYLRSLQVLRNDIANTRNFEGLEVIRRRLGDAGFGMPEEGYKAIGQGFSKDIYTALSDSMKKYNKSFDKYLSDYKRLSQNLEAYSTKIGRALTETQDAAGKYVTKTGEQISKQVFDSPENYKVLVDALGGNEQLARAAARKYFVSQMSNVNTSEKAFKFLSDNRAKLLATNLFDEFKKIFEQLKTTEKRGGAFEKYAGEQKALLGEETKAAKTSVEEQSKQIGKLKTLQKDLQTHESNLITAKDPADIARINESFAKDLLNKDLINQQQYQNLINQTNEILNKVADKKQAVAETVKLIGKTVGYGTAGTLGYYGVKSIGGQ